jgi:hypothetical protein
MILLSYAIGSYNISKHKTLSSVFQWFTGDDRRGHHYCSGRRFLGVRSLGKTSDAKQLTRRFRNS